MKILIGIPVHNEENNIGKLLDDILAQELDNDISKDIIIVSDGSIDNTDEIVTSFTEKYRNIRLIKRQDRLGKYQALNLIFDIANKYDVLILLDGDVRLTSNILMSLSGRITRSNDVGLVAGNPVPYKPRRILCIAEYASFFGWVLVDKIKMTHRPCIYHAHGRVLALSKKLYENIRIPETMGVGDDQFIYLSCINNGLKFEYFPSAIVFYKSPETISDFVKQSIRFSASVREKEMFFDKQFIKHHMCNVNKPLIFFQSFIQYPYEGLCWTFAYTIGKLSIFFKKRNVTSSWEISKTTK